MARKLEVNSEMMETHLMLISEIVLAQGMSTAGAVLAEVAQQQAHEWRSVVMDILQQEKHAMTKILLMEMAALQPALLRLALRAQTTEQ